MYGQETNKVAPPPKQPKQVNIDEWEEIVREKYKIPKGLWQAIPRQESSGAGGWDAVSGTGVRGKWQVTENTAKGYGLDRNDPYQQVVAAARTLRDGYDAEANEPDEQKRWLRSTGRYYYGAGAVDANGNISTRSKDGVSTPANHLGKIAKYWGEYEKQNRPTAEVPQQAAAPSGSYYHPPDGEHRGFTTNYPLEPVVRTPEEQELDARVGKPMMWSGTDTDSQGAETGRGVALYKPAGVEVKPKYQPNKREQEALRSISAIDAGKKRALELFKQADAAAKDLSGIDSGQSAERANALRQQAEAALEQANMYARGAQEKYGDLVEVGFGKDSDPNSKRQWAYAKPKSTGTWLAQDQQRLQAHDQRNLDALNVSPEAKARFEKERAKEERLKKIRESYTGLDPVARAATRVMAKLGGASTDEISEAMPALSPVEDWGNRFTQGAIKTLSSIPEGAERLFVQDNLTLPGQQPVSPRKPFLSGLAKAGETLAETVAPVDKNDQGFWTAKLPEGIGSAVPFLASGLLGGGTKAAAMLGASMNAQQAGEELDRMGVTDPATRNKAIAAAGLIGSLEAFGIEGKLGKVLGGKGGIVKRLTEAAGEGFQEWTTEELNDINAKLIAAYDPNRSVDPFQKKQLEAAALGALIGGGFEGAGKLAEISGDRADVRAIQNERAPMPGIVPTMQGPTQITPILNPPSAVKSAANQQSQAKAQTMLANQQAAQVQQSVASQVSAPENQAVPSNVGVPEPPPQARLSRLPAPQLQGVAALLAAQSGKAPVESRINDQLDAAEIALNEGDTKNAERRLNASLRAVTDSPGYLEEAKARIGGQQLAATPYSNLRSEIEAKLQEFQQAKQLEVEAQQKARNVESLAKKEAATQERAQQQEARLTKKREDYIRSAVGRSVVPSVAAIQRTFQTDFDTATAFQAEITEAVQANRSTAESPPEAAPIPDKVSPSDALRQEADAAKIEAMRLEQSGDFAAAAQQHVATVSNLKRLRRVLGVPKTPEAVSLLAQIDSEIVGAEANQKAATRQARIVNAQTRDLAGTQKKNVEKLPSSEPVNTAPLLRSEAAQNPEGGIPKMPEPTFTDRLDAAVRKDEAARGKAKPAKRLISRIAELGGISNRYAGELQGVRDAKRIGVVRERAEMSPDILARQLQSEGYDVDPENLDTLWQAIDRDVLSKDERAANTSDLNRRLQKEEADYYAQQEADYAAQEPMIEPTNRLREESDYEGGELQRYSKPLAAQETEATRARAKGFAPDASGVSFSPYADLIANNREKVNRLYGMNLTEPRAQAIIQELRAFSVLRSIELRHLHALLDDIVNTQAREAGWRDRGVSPEAFAEAERGKTLEYLGKQEQNVDRQIEAVKRRSTPDTQELIEREMRAIDELAGIIQDDPDMLALYNDAIGGAETNVEDFVYAAGRAYGIAEDTARTIIDGRRQDYQFRLSDSRRRVQTESQTRPAQATAKRQKRGNFTEADTELLDRNPATVSDEDFDSYLKRLEEIRNLNIYGEVFGGVDLPPSLARKVRVRIAQANEERHVRVMDKKLGAKHEKRYVPTLEERQEVFDLLDRTINEPQASRDQKVAELRKAQEVRRSAKAAKPIAISRVIQHSQFGEVREAADQDGVGSGKLRVVDADGQAHVIQNPRGKDGNQNATFVKKDVTLEGYAPSKSVPKSQPARAEPQSEDRFYKGDAVTWQRGDNTEFGTILKVVSGYATVERADGSRPTVHVSKLKAAELGAAKTKIDGLVADEADALKQEWSLLRTFGEENLEGALDNARIQASADPGNPRAGILYINSNAKTIINKIWEANGNGRLPAAFAFDRDALVTFSELFRHEASFLDGNEAKQVNALADAFDEVSGENYDGAGVINVDLAKQGYFDVARNHELFHVWQYSQSAPNSPDRNPMAVEWARKISGYDKVRDSLLKKGYADDAEDIVREFAAYAATNDLERLGFSKQEAENVATDFLYEYFTQISKQYGAEHLERIGRISIPARAVVERVSHEVRTTQASRRIESEGRSDQRETRSPRSVTVSSISLPGWQGARRGTGRETVTAAKIAPIQARAGKDIEGSLSRKTAEQRGLKASFGELANEPQGQFLTGSIFGGFQNFLGKQKPASHAVPKAEPVPADWNPKKFAKQSIDALLTRDMSREDREAYFSKDTTKAERAAIAQKYINPRMDQDADALAKAIQRAQAAVAANDGADLREAVWQAHHIVQRPATRLEKAGTLMRAGMFSRIPGRLRDVISNSAFQKLEAAARIPGSAADTFLGILSGQRTLLAPRPGQYVANRSADRADQWQQVKEVLAGKHVDALEDVMQHREVDFDSKILDAYTKTVFRAMGAVDQWFFVKEYRRALREVAELAARQDVRNGVIQKGDRDAQQDYYEAAPTLDMKAFAEQSAKQVVFRNANWFSDQLIKGVREKIGDKGNFALDIVMPVDRTPTNVILRALEYSPLGAVKLGAQGLATTGRVLAQTRRNRKAGIPTKQAIQQAISEKFTPAQQRAMSQLIGRVSVGAAPVALGYFLAAAGMATGFYDDEDRDAEALRSALNARPSSIQVGGRWYELGGIAPLGMLISLGATLHRDTHKKSKSDDPETRYKSIVKGFADAVLELPALEAAKETKKLATDVTDSPSNLGRFMGSHAGRFVPGALGDIGQLTPGLRDDKERQVKTPKPKMKSGQASLGKFGREFLGEIALRMPGARKLLPEKKNAFGEAVPTYRSDVFDPFRSRPAVDSPVFSVAGEQQGIKLPVVSSTDKPRKNETPEEMEARILRAQKIITRYGAALLKHPLYLKASPEMQERMVEALKDRAMNQAAKKVVDSESLHPATIHEALKNRSTAN